MNNSHLYEKLSQIKKECIEHRIPIIRDKTLDLINKLIQTNQFKNILEVGTAYGYSAAAFSLNPSITSVTTLEKRDDNYLIAIRNLKDFNKIQVINVDANDYETHMLFDLIFIDGAKSHQEIIFNKYIKNLSNVGIMVIDNIFLKKFDDLPILNKRQLKLKQAVKNFYNFLIHQSNYQIEIIDIDDGIAIVRK